MRHGRNTNGLKTSQENSGKERITRKCTPNGLYTMTQPNTLEPGQSKSLEQPYTTSMARTTAFGSCTPTIRHSAPGSMTSIDKQSPLWAKNSTLGESVPSYTTPMPPIHKAPSTINTASASKKKPRPCYKMPRTHVNPSFKPVGVISECAHPQRAYLASKRCLSSF